MDNPYAKYKASGIKIYARSNVPDREEFVKRFKLNEALAGREKNQHKTFKLMEAMTLPNEKGEQFLLFEILDSPRIKNLKDKISNLKTNKDGIRERDKMQAKFITDSLAEINSGKGGASFFWAFLAFFCETHRVAAEKFFKDIGLDFPSDEPLDSDDEDDDTWSSPMDGIVEKHTFDHDYVNTNISMLGNVDSTRIKLACHFGSISHWELNDDRFEYSIGIQTVRIELKAKEKNYISSIKAHNDSINIKGMSLCYKQNKLDLENNTITQLWDIDSIPARKINFPATELCTVNWKENSAAEMQALAKPSDIRVTLLSDVAHNEVNETVAQIKRGIVKKFIEKAQQKLALDDERFIAPLAKIKFEKPS